MCVKPCFFHLTDFVSWFSYPWPHTKGAINRDFAVCWNRCFMKGESGVYAQMIVKPLSIISEGTVGNK
jgi:hypothetical protein